MRVSPNEKSIADSFFLIERHLVDLLVEKAFYANGIPFNVLRNPDFIAMMKGIKHAPKDYKLPSYDKEKNTSLYECKRDIEKNLTPLKDTWFSNEVSIISDGWKISSISLSLASMHLTTVALYFYVLGISKVCYVTYNLAFLLININE